MRTMGIFLVACAIAALTAANGAEPKKEARVHDHASQSGDLFKKADTNGDGAVTLEEIQDVAPTFPAERFQAIDHNRDGRIDAKELQRMKRATQAKAGDLFKRADANEDGHVTLDEFRAVAPKMDESRFAQLDRNGDGGITLNELIRQHPPQSASDPGKRFRKADKNGDGKVSYDELTTQMPDLTQERFAHMDRNNDGVLSPEDRKESTPRKRTGNDSHVSRAAAARKLMETDADKDGSVTFKEVTAAKPGFPRKAFDRYDTNGDGILSAADYAGT